MIDHTGPTAYVENPDGMSNGSRLGTDRKVLISLSSYEGHIKKIELYYNTGQAGVDYEIGEETAVIRRIYQDLNGNGQWDADRGETGFGGARDAISLTATARYNRLFPMNGLLGLPSTVTISASTVLRNQPFDDQDRTVTLENCE